MKEIKAVVFDMDGVMFDTERLMNDAWVRAGEEMGVPVTEEIMLLTLGIDAKTSYGILRRHLGEDFDLEALRPAKNRYVEAYLKEHGLPVKPGLYELLRYLRDSGYKTAVASSTVAAKVKENLEAAGVSEFFDAVVGGDMIEHGKPEPDIYLEACRRLGLPPESCAAIEDSPAGLRSAYRAGLTVIMVPDLIQPDERLADVEFAVLGGLGEVRRAIEN